MHDPAPFFGRIIQKKLTAVSPKSLRSVVSIGTAPQLQTRRLKSSWTAHANSLGSMYVWCIRGPNKHKCNNIACLYLDQSMQTSPITQNTCLWKSCVKRAGVLGLVHFLKIWAFEIINANQNRLWSPIQRLDKTILQVTRPPKYLAGGSEHHLKSWNACCLQHVWRLHRALTQFLCDLKGSWWGQWKWAASLPA